MPTRPPHVRFQRGVIALDEDVNLSLTSWRVPENEFTKQQKVTVRRLVNHTAGFGSDDVGSYEVGEALPTLVQALDGTAPAKCSWTVFESRRRSPHTVGRIDAVRQVAALSGRRSDSTCSTGRTWGPVFTVRVIWESVFPWRRARYRRR